MCDEASGDFRVVVGAGGLVRLDCDAPVRVLCEAKRVVDHQQRGAEDICLSAGQQAQGCQGVVLLEGEGCSGSACWMRQRLRLL